MSHQAIGTVVYFAGIAAVIAGLLLMEYWK